KAAWHVASGLPGQCRTYIYSQTSFYVFATDTSHQTIRNHFELLGRRRARPIPAPGSGGVNIEHERKQVKVQQLISAYRSRGHKLARLDPLGLMVRDEVPDLQLQFHGLTEADLDTTFQAGTLYIGKEEA